MFAAAKEGCPMAFVVVQHLSPDHRSMVADLLDKQTVLEVERVVDAEVPRAGHVYVIEPLTTVELRDGSLVVKPLTRDGSLRLPVDVLFRSLADEMGSRATCVILSGTGSDGTRGARVIKEQGGVVIVQDPDTCAFDGMPVSAIEAGVADVVLSPEDMVGHLTRANETAGSLTEDDRHAVSVFHEITALLSESSDVDFGLHKPSSLYRRIDKRLRLLHYRDPDGYLERLKADAAERERLTDELLIGVTRFFAIPAP